MEYTVLNNGVKMPMLGYGVFRMTDEKECEEGVCQAIQAGYRYIDTASAYMNEEAVGRGIKRAGIPREELFVATKLWIPDTTYEKAKAAYQRSLDRLGLDYVDLYIIHQPYNDLYGAWRALEELYRDGKVRAIGVDNFDDVRLADFIQFNEVKPMVNLVEVNPLFQRESERRYAAGQNVQMEAWSPFAAGQDSVFKNETLIEIGSKYHKSPAQVVLRWLLQRGIVSLCKSSNPKRIRQNLDIFDFILSEEDMKAIADLDTGKSCFQMRTTGELVDEFVEGAKKIEV